MPVQFTQINSLETDTTESFFSDHFLRARINDNKPSNNDYDPIFEEGRSEGWVQSHGKEIKENDLKYEEDVNQYISLVLAEMVNPNRRFWPENIWWVPIPMRVKLPLT